MSKIDDVSLGTVLRGVRRYQPYLLVVAAVLLVVAFTPGTPGPDEQAVGTVGDGPGGAGSDVVTGDRDWDLDGDGEPDDPDRARTGPGAGAGPRGGGGRGGAAGQDGEEAVRQRAAQGGMVANCDPATGRIAIPTRHAPPCVPAHTGDNGGATYQGVTGDKIRVAVYLAQGNPAADAILAAAGADDDREEVIAQHEQYREFYLAHYEQYGRDVELVYIDGSGPAEDDAVGRADARRVIDAGVFASINAPNNAYVDELVARGIMCFCTVSLPVEFYHQRAPFVWSTLMASTEAYVHRAEYVGKRLAGRPAEHAGDPVLATQERRFGLLYYETPAGEYKAGIDFFERELARYGVRLANRLAYEGFPNIAATQQQARPLIQRMIQDNVTSIIFAGDPFGPIFFTQEATRQRYFPEWIITGSALTDTSFFARTYDPAQWRNAFGVSMLSARLPEAQSETMRLLQWHFGRGPEAEGTYGVIRGPWENFYRGVHLAGPNLNPGTFRDGMFNAPPSGVGGITSPQMSFGRHVWPWDNYLAFDDMTEIWWDPQARGEDEIGNDGIGLYRFVEMGRRYLPGQWPDGPPRAFDPANTVTIYDQPPEADRWPEYPPPR